MKGRPSAADPSQVFEPAEHPEFLDHRAHRPRQVHAGRPLPRIHRGAPGPRDGGPGPGLHGPRARARHHHQGPPGPPELHGRRRAAVRAEPDRHAGPRRLLVRGHALAGRVRRRAAGGGRQPGRGGADAGQRVPRRGQQPRDHPGHQQDRPAQRAARGSPPPDRRHHRPRRQPAPFSPAPRKASAPTRSSRPSSRACRRRRATPTRRSRP